MNMSSYQLQSQLQIFIPEFQNFLKQLENSKISKLQQKDREDLLKKLDNLLRDFPDQLKSGKDSASIQSQRSNEEDVNEVYEFFEEPTVQRTVERRGSEPAQNFIAADTVLHGCRISGNLTRKNSSKGMFDLQNLVNKFFGKKFCVVKQGVFYIFDKNTSKKQDLAIILKGYDVRNVYDKKEFIFELVSPGKPTYTFSSPSNEERNLWLKVLEKEVYVTADARAALISSDEEMNYRSENNQNNNSDYIEELYDDIATEPEPPKNTPKNITKFEKNNEKNKEPISDDIQEIYEDDVNVIAKNTKTEAANAKILEGEVNEFGCRYDSLFYGLWDCRADAKDELPFKQGEIIEILGKDYEKFGWWVGRLGGKVGIVPKEYVSPAYRMIAA